MEFAQWSSYDIICTIKCIQVNLHNIAHNRICAMERIIIQLYDCTMKLVQ